MTIKVTRQLIADIKALLTKRPPVPYQQVLKYDRNQPRGPKGSPTGGRWVKDVSRGAGGMDTQSESRLDPDYMVPGMVPNRGNARYEDIENAPKGKGFMNRPRGVGVPEPQPGSEVTTALSTGTVTDTQPLGGGANASYIVTLDEDTKAVYKPEAGELWAKSGFANSDISEYVTNRKFSLAEREATAYQVSQALGIPYVPPTVLRKSLTSAEVDPSDMEEQEDEGGGYDTDYAREQYEKYKEKALERAYDLVGEEMGNAYYEAQKEHAKNIEARAEEMTDIWNEAIKDFPDDDQYGSETFLRKEHPALPLGSQHFSRPDKDLGALDPLEVLKEADVNFDGALNDDEKVKIEKIIREKLAEGYSELADVDEEEARDDLDRDQWYEDHADTENRMLESKVRLDTDWRHDQGYESETGGGGYGGGGVRNSQAPHPNGGSLQQFISMSRYGELSEEAGARFAVLDYVVGTMDRHGGNIGYADDGGEPVAIDNGYAFPGSSDPDGFTFRSVPVQEWLGNSGSKSVPSSIRQPMLDSLNKTDWQALVDRHPGMNAAEREALLGRVETMRDALATPEGLYRLWKRQSLMGAW